MNPALSSTVNQLKLQKKSREPLIRVRRGSVIPHLGKGKAKNHTKKGNGPASEFCVHVKMQEWLNNEGKKNKKMRMPCALSIRKGKEAR